MATVGIKGFSGISSLCSLVFADRLVCCELCSVYSISSERHWWDVVTADWYITSKQLNTGHWWVSFTWWMQDSAPPPLSLSLCFIVDTANSTDTQQCDCWCAWCAGVVQTGVHIIVQERHGGRGLAQEVWHLFHLTTMFTTCDNTCRFLNFFDVFLGRLLWVDLVKPVSINVRTAVCPQKISPISTKFAT